MDGIIEKIEKLSMLHDKISPEIIKEKDIKLGLRNPDGSGVVVGITTKGIVIGYEKTQPDDASAKTSIKPVHGKLYYCGYDVEKIIESLECSNRFGFEETCYLLFTGELPEKTDLEEFETELAKRRPLSKSERHIIMQEVQNENQMYALHSVISHMSRCDDNSDAIDISNVTRQCLNLVAKFPTVVANNYNMMRFSKGSDLMYLRPKPELSTSENFLYMLKGEVPDIETARIFDIALILHADHGGGNNSTFAVRVVSSSGANTYMAIASGIASLSGYLHGGANEAVQLMMNDAKKSIKNWESEKQIEAYIAKILKKTAGDGSGKVYGFGHAVYTLSDPRAVILKRLALKLAEKHNAVDEFNLYSKFEDIAARILSEGKVKGISSNVDFYSGFIYKLMGIPRELYTPIFAMSRVVGWCAHRMEQIIQSKIIRPAYITVDMKRKQYEELEKRGNDNSSRPESAVY